jgi:hypothetical protein
VPYNRLQRLSPPPAIYQVDCVLDATQEKRVDVTVGLRQQIKEDLVGGNARLNGSITDQIMPVEAHPLVHSGAA